MAFRPIKLPVLTTKAKILVAVAIVFFVALGAMGVVMLLLQPGADSVQKDFTKSDARTRQEDAVELAEQALESGNTKRADNVYQKAIDAEPNAAKKVDLAIDYSRMLRTSDRLKDAIEVAKKAEAYQDDKYKIAVWLAALYALDKQYDEAIEYYTLAANSVNSPDNKGFSKVFFENQIKKMKQAAAKR